VAECPRATRPTSANGTLGLSVLTELQHRILALLALQGDKTTVEVVRALGVSRERHR